MGNARMNPKDWADHSSRASTKTREEIFTARAMKTTLDPVKITVRESCDSDANPASTPIILASDVTGSMGTLAEVIVRHGIGLIMEEIYAREPVTDPHIAVLAIGDTYFDRAPIQATQFEASIVLADQMKDIYLEGGGGGNQGESYLAAWYFAAFKTRTDSMLKRRKKGYLFTIGDEPPLLTLPKDHIKRFFGDEAQADMTAADLFAAASQSWEIFHCIVKVPGRPRTDSVLEWEKLIGAERCIHLQDVATLPETIVSAIQIHEGADAGAVAGSWSGGTALVVAEAVRQMVPGSASGDVRL